MFIDLKLVQYKQYLKIDKQDSNTVVFDAIRKKYLVLTPEEFVRQLVIHYLIKEQSISPLKILIEKEIEVGHRRKRFDIVVLDRTNEPSLLIECKSHTEPINDTVFQQAGFYNLNLEAPYIMITNGISSLISMIDFENKKYEFLDRFPVLPLQ